MTFAFVAAIFGSGYLLFLVQPLIAKQILPWFGGTAAVWAVCLVFYQVALLAGYLYAHVLTRRLGPRGQAMVHCAVVVLSLLALPVGLSGAPPSGAGAPEWRIVWTLVRSIGLPYFVLSATSPLLQAWYARVQLEGRAYRLFSLSNLACTLSLLSFPLWWELAYPLSTLNRMWSWSFGVEAALLALVALMAVKPGEARVPEPMNSRWSWVWFSALGSALLVATTTHLCQMVAPIPFLWILPLLLYLLTFVIVFERDWYRRWWGAPLALVSALAMTVPLVGLSLFKGFVVEVALYSTGMFVACLFCHGELSARKPATGHLTLFYIVMAAGGALGSALVALVAPAAFRGYVEFPLLLVAVAVCTLLVTVRRKSDPAFVLVGVLAALVVAGGAGAVVVRVYVHPVAAGRNFYGSLWVSDKGEVRQLNHGNIVHGSQFLSGEHRKLPTTYYAPETGAGRWLSRDGPPRKVGLIGLGAGTLAAYGRAGDEFRFYEINPLAPEMASRYFGYLRDSRAKVDVALGDARLVLESEPRQAFDLLVIDAFSGDAIPVHLITTEALQLYLRHLKPDGVLAYHITNQYLELYPQLRRQAESLGLEARLCRNESIPERGALASKWMLAARREAAAQLLEGERDVPPGSPRIWTDDYSSLLSALKTE